MKTSEIHKGKSRHGYMRFSDGDFIFVLKDNNKNLIRKYSSYYFDGNNCISDKNFKLLNIIL